MLALRAVPMAPLSPVMRTGTLTRWHVAVGDHVRVGALLYDVTVDRLTLDGDAPVEMEVEAHEDVYISALLVREGESVAPSAAVALAFDHEEELLATRAPPSRDELALLTQREEHQFMWQGYVRNAQDGGGMCDKKCRPPAHARCSSNVTSCASRYRASAARLCGHAPRRSVSPAAPRRAGLGRCASAARGGQEEGKSIGSARSKERP